MRWPLYSRPVANQPSLGFLHLSRWSFISPCQLLLFLCGRREGPHLELRNRVIPRTSVNPGSAAPTPFSELPRYAGQHRLSFAFAILYHVLSLPTKRALTDRNVAVFCALSSAGNLKRESHWLVLPVHFGPASTTLSAFCNGLTEPACPERGFVVVRY